MVLVLSATAWEASYWPRHDYPGAMWHQQDRGEDIELGQDRAAAAGWRELLGFWTGPMLHGHGYWRPLTSWLFVAEYRLFGRDDRRWAAVNFGLTLALAAAVLYCAAAVFTGTTAMRLLLGSAAALLLLGPGAADRDVQRWTVGWWPCQPELISLLIGLGLLTACRSTAVTGRAAWLPCLLLAVGVCFKEMAYLAGIAGCAMLLRGRRWHALAALAFTGIALYAYRGWALGELAGRVSGGDLSRVLRAGAGLFSSVPQDLAALSHHVLLWALCWTVLLPLRRRWSLLPRAAVATAGYLALAVALLGSPLEPAFQHGLAALGRLAGLGVLAIGLWHAPRDWPLPELGLLALLSAAVAWSFPPVYGWYGLWLGTAGAMLQAAALYGAAAVLHRRLTAGRPDPA